MTRLPLFDPPQIKLLTVRQPFAHLIIFGGKDIENRSWSTQYRGRLYIHAGGKLHRGYRGEAIDPDRLVMSSVIGHVDLVDVVTRSTSRWFDDEGYGWVLREPRPIKPVALRGQMGLFEAPRSLLDGVARHSPR